MVKLVPLLDSFFQGGFECSTHRLRNGKRLDEIAATRHETFARQIINCFSNKESYGP